MLLDMQLSSVHLRLQTEQKGLFVFIDEGGLGKTYLMSILDALENEAIYVVTYNSDKNILDYEINKALHNKYQLILMDRCDLYMTEELYRQLEQKAQDMCIYLDLKNYSEYAKVLPNVGTLIYREGELILG